MRIKYWDNSILLINRGLSLAIKCSTDNQFDWLLSEVEGEQFVLVVTKEEEANMIWDEMTFPYSLQYIKRVLYYYGHFEDITKLYLVIANQNW